MAEDDFKIGDRVIVKNIAEGNDRWIGFVGKVTRINRRDDGSIRHVYVYNPEFKDNGNWIFVDGRLEKL